MSEKKENHKSNIEKTKKYNAVQDDEVIKKSKPKKQSKQTKKTNVAEPKKKKKKIWKIIRITILIIILLSIIGVGAAIGIFFGMFGDELKISEKELTIKFVNSYAYDLEGNVIASFSGDENRDIISLADMPKYLPKAFVSIEDERFYSHHGVDIKRTAGATVQYILKKGTSSYGGSTITQQLIKNLSKEDDDSGVEGIIRKVKEMAKAYQVEKMKSKDQILELYLNMIFLGGKTYGVEVAAHYYFNKSAKDLDLAECAFLAGINHSPNRYDPFDKEGADNEAIKHRTKVVLVKMNELGAIDTNEEYEAAMKQVDDGLKFEEGKITDQNYSYLVAAAKSEVVAEYAKEYDLNEQAAERLITSGGYKIYTTQDTPKQKIMEEEFLKEKYIVSSKENPGEHTQAAMVLIENSTGRVIATVGGLGDDVNSQGVNRAVQGYGRQPGSSIKPIAVILPGLYNNIITAGTVYDDSPTTFPGNYPVTNSTKYLALDTIAHGIGNSSNVMMTKAISNIGVLNSISFMRTKLRISTLVTAKENDKYNDENISTALGGITYGIKPVEMAAAYETIANDGVYIEPTFYVRVEDADGNVVLESKQEREEVYSKQIAYIAKQILLEPVTGEIATASYCRISGMDVAAKTGTTDNNADRWLCGFTPYYTAATWFGYDKNEKVRGFGTNPAGQIWSSVMKQVSKGQEGKRFEKPSSGIVMATICRDSGMAATEDCTRKQTLPFIKGTVPNKCDVHTKVMICKESEKVATEFCPEDQVEERILFAKPKTEQTSQWKTSQEKYTVIEETCPIHTTPQEVKVKVPNVLGQTEEKARQMILDAKLKCTVKYEQDQDKTNGVVLKQSIGSDTEVAENSEVIITVNKVTSNPKPPEGNTVTGGNTINSGNTINTNTITNSVGNTVTPIINSIPTY